MDYGFAVTAVGTVSEALAHVNGTECDVLVSDLNIDKPGDGFLVIAAMRLLQPKCITLVLTGYPAFDTAVEGIRHCINDYLVKPVKIDELVNAININLKLKARRSLRAGSSERAKKTDGRAQ
jgi:ActR/RegA family two-component response regulator